MGAVIENDMIDKIKLKKSPKSALPKDSCIKPKYIYQNEQNKKKISQGMS